MLAGNWKMNGSLAALKELKSLNDFIGTVACEVVVCPPATLLIEALKLTKDNQITIGAQNCHYNNSGAHTGEISAQMLKDLGIKITILGHSERRVENFETNTVINQKATNCHANNVTTIICIGESEQQKKMGQTSKIISNQLEECLPISATEENTIIAYEPIWAIGTGQTPSAIEISEAHSILRSKIVELTNMSLGNQIRIIYGGSVNTKNSYEILQVNGVDGALVGGASLLASDFSQIIRSATRV